ncbi:MAG: formylmethanofuran dehydrogenase subunit E family protein [Clostridia bacterium]
MASHNTRELTGDNATAWYWPAWAAQASLPTFQVRDTESSHGRYAQATKTVLVKDLVKFHGHACDGLFRGVIALSLALPRLFPDGVVDRTDLRVLSRNSPCLGDVAAYLTGARVRFNTQDVRGEPGVWFVVQRGTAGETVRVTENAGVYPPALTAEESRLTATPSATTPQALDALQAAQWDWVRTVLLATPWQALYTVTPVPDFVWESVPYKHAGQRTDVLFRDIPRDR